MEKLLFNIGIDSLVSKPGIIVHIDNIYILSFIKVLDDDNKMIKIILLFNPSTANIH